MLETVKLRLYRSDPFRIGIAKRGHSDPRTHVDIFFPVLIRQHRAFSGYDMHRKTAVGPRNIRGIKIHNVHIIHAFHP